MPATFGRGIQIQPKGFEKVEENLNKIPDALKEAIRRTVRKSIPFAEKEAIRLITNRYDITQSSLMDQSRRSGKTQIKEIPPGRKGTNKITGGLYITGTRFPVMRFRVAPSYVPNQKGIPVRGRTVVTVSVRKGKPQVGHSNVFLAKMQSGHLGVYRRKYPNPGGPRTIRPDGQPTQVPLTEEFMLSVPEMLSSKPIRVTYEKNLNKYVTEVFMEETKGQAFKFKG
jgi:hypothetical protein